MKKKKRKTILTLKHFVASRYATFLFLFLILGAKAYAQEGEKEISIHVQDTPVRDVFELLEKSAQLHFMYEDETIASNPKVTLRYLEAPLSVILNDLCTQASLRYEVKSNIILIFPVSVPKPKQEEKAMEITGTVFDENRQPLIGVNVFIAGTTNGTITDIDGKYKIPVLPGQLLAFRFIGMTDKTILIRKDSKTVDVLMEPASIDLGDVIVTGYQTISKERATGAFGIMKGEELEKKLQPNLKSVLEGQTPGVVLDKKGNLEIRGVSTFSAESTPLLVVDSYPYEGKLEDLNPDNIENITVLKDGVAASIYGSRAANGVIVVTTKRGQSGQPKVSYKGSFSVVLKPLLSKLNMASTSDYIDAEVELFNQWPSRYNPTDPYDISHVSYLLMQENYGLISPEEARGQIEQLRQINGLKQVEKHMFRHQLGQQHNISVSGGDDNYAYNAAINYNKTRGHFLQTSNDRLTVDLSNQWTPYSFLTLDLGANVVYSRSDKPAEAYQDMLNYSSGSVLQPYTAIVDGNGNPIDVWRTSQYKISVYESLPGMKDWRYNPIDDLSKDGTNTADFKARISGKVRLNILDELNVEVGGVWERGNYLEKRLTKADSYLVRIGYNDATSKSNMTNHYLPDGAIINEDRSINENWTVRTQLNFNKSLDEEKHRITAILGNEVRRSRYDINRMPTKVGYNEISGSDNPVNMLDFMSGRYQSDMLFGFDPSYVGFEYGNFFFQDNRFVSWYGNGSYEYDNRFILSGSIRLDLTNFFGTDSKYRYKPLWSVGGTYKLSNEKFFQVPWINRLHLRASYGINGNISLTEGPFLILGSDGYQSMTGGVSYYIASPANNQLRWEKTQTTNVGIDASFLRNRVNLSVDYYTKNSSDLLSSDVIDPTTGYYGLTKNTGEITNRGVEIGLGVTPVNNRKFKWDINYNFAYNYNKVEKYDVTRNYTSDYTSPIGARFVEGYPANSLWGYRFAGLNEEGSSMIYNAEGEITPITNARIEDLYYQGTYRPNIDMSMTHNFSYLNWDLSFMLIAKLGHKYRKDSFTGSNHSNRHVGERWMKPGDEANTIYPALKLWNMDMFEYPFIDKLVGNAGYMKLRDVTLSYTFKQPLVNNIYFSDMRVYFQMRNLLTITAKGTDIDPETAEVNETGYTGPSLNEGFTSLPLRPEFYCGISFTF